MWAYILFVYLFILFRFVRSRDQRSGPFDCLSLDSDFVAELGDPLLVVTHSFLQTEAEDNENKKQKKTV